MGRGDRSGVRWAGWVAAGVAAVYMAGLAVVFALAPAWFTRLYTTDAAVLAVAVPALLVCAVAAVPDGVQTVFIGALRGASDVWPATALYVVAFWIVMVPLGYWLAVPRAMGAPGPDDSGRRRRDPRRRAPRLALPAGVRPRRPAGVKESRFRCDTGHPPGNNRVPDPAGGAPDQSPGRYQGQQAP